MAGYGTLEVVSPSVNSVLLVLGGVVIVGASLHRRVDVARRFARWSSRTMFAMQVRYWQEAMNLPADDVEGMFAVFVRICFVLFGASLIGAGLLRNRTF